MLAAQAPVTACHSEFQMAPIFPLMAQRSGRQHIVGEGGPRHTACSRGSIREERETRGGRREVSSITPVVMYSFFFFFYDYFGDCVLILGWVERLIGPSLLLATSLMVEPPGPVKPPLTVPAHLHSIAKL